MDNIGTLGMVLALAVGAVKLFEKLTEWAIARIKDRKSNKGGNGRSGSNGSNGHGKFENLHLLIKETNDVVQLKDNDGVPMVYWPRSQIETQREIVKTLQEIYHTNDKMADKLEQIASNTKK